jgi:hypothetical protein
MSPRPLPAQQEQPKKQKKRVLTWDPPQVTWKLKSQLPSPPCDLPTALQMAGDRANKLFDSLKSFTAREDIQFQALSAEGPDNSIMMGGNLYTPRSAPESDFAGSYDYLVLYKQTPAGLVAEDSRTAPAGKAQPRFDQDLGLPELALIFLPGMRTDYDFKCDGTVQWNGQPAWVLHFQQRKDKPLRSVAFRGGNSSYPASLQGRAWIDAASGEILHMETSLIDPIKAVNVQHWFLSIKYAPVVFPSQNQRMLLPESVDAYCDFGNRRTIAYHVFSDFKLFSATMTIRTDLPDTPTP